MCSRLARLVFLVRQVLFGAPCVIACFPADRLCQPTCIGSIQLSTVLPCLPMELLACGVIPTILPPIGLNTTFDAARSACMDSVSLSVRHTTMALARNVQVPEVTEVSHLRGFQGPSMPLPLSEPPPLWVGLPQPMNSCVS